MINQKALLLVAFTSALFVGCSPKIEQTSTVETPINEDDLPIIDTKETEDFDRGDSDAQAYATEYDIDMTDFEYSLTDLQAKPGDTITINLTNSEGTHDLVITELDVHSEHLDEGTADVMTIAIPADIEPGQVYSFFCSVDNHREVGMVGTITII